jgi:hypothetical protein
MKQKDKDDYKLSDQWELEQHERQYKEYNKSARLQRTGNKPYLPKPSQHGFTSCGCQICERTYANIKKTNAKIKPSLEFEAMEIVTKAVELLVKKHEDYGPANISDAPGGPLNGLSVRLHDKVARLNNLLSHHKKPKNETIEDTFVDILNYAVIALLVLDGKWDTTK